MPRPHPAWAPSQVRRSDGAAGEASPQQHRTMGGLGSQRDRARRGETQSLTHGDHLQKEQSPRPAPNGRSGEGSGDWLGSTGANGRGAEASSGWCQTRLQGWETRARLPPSLGLQVPLSDMVRTKRDITAVPDPVPSTQPASANGVDVQMRQLRPREVV